MERDDPSSRLHPDRRSIRRSNLAGVHASRWKRHNPLRFHTDAGVRARSALVAMRPATPRVTADQRAPRELQASLPSRGHQRADHPCSRRAVCVRFGHGDCYSIFHNLSESPILPWTRVSRFAAM
jgi:hypothetical protein